MDKRFRVVAVGVQLPDQFDELVLCSDVKVEIGEKPIGLTDKYVMECAVGVEFACNPAQFDRALRDAVKRVARILNAETLSEIDNLRMAIHAGDRLKALNLCDEMARRLSGEKG